MYCSNVRMFPNRLFSTAFKPFTFHVTILILSPVCVIYEIVAVILLQIDHESLSLRALHAWCMRYGNGNPGMLQDVTGILRVTKE